MTDHDETSTPDGVDALSGAYASDALDDVERAKFEEHLRGCAECRTEVAELRETLSLLHTDEVAPPAELRDRALAGIEEIRPLPPLVDGADTPVDLASRRHRRLLRFRWPLIGRRFGGADAGEQPPS